jgi:hypothetical protein
VSRTVKHRHVRTVLAAIDRAIASPHHADIVHCVAGYIVDHADSGERFEPRLCGGTWTYEGLRAVLLATALHAPARELEGMAYWAQKQIEWVEWWEIEGHYESSGLPVPGKVAA